MRLLNSILKSYNGFIQQNRYDNAKTEVCYLEAWFFFGQKGHRDVWMLLSLLFISGNLNFFFANYLIVCETEVGTKHWSIIFKRSVLFSYLRAQGCQQYSG